MNDQADQDRIALVRLDELVVMGFLSEVEVGCERVFKEVDDQISREHQESGGPSAQGYAGGDHLDNRSGQHESRTERNEILQIRAIPVFLNNDGAAKKISEGRRQAEQHAEQDTRTSFPFPVFSASLGQGTAPWG